MPVDYKEYPPNWKTKIRPFILDRAKHCCEVCNVPNYATIFRAKVGTSWLMIPDDNMTHVVNPKIFNMKYVKIVLTVAHLDHDHLNHEVSMDRLKAMCQKCHLSYDSQHHVASRKSKKKIAIPELF